MGSNNTNMKSKNKVRNYTIIIFIINYYWHCSPEINAVENHYLIKTCTIKHIADMLQQELILLWKEIHKNKKKIM